MYIGKVNEWSTMIPGIIYRCAEKKPMAGEYVPIEYHYRFLVAFDLGNPIGTCMKLTAFHSATDLRKIDLLALGTMRAFFDEFIRTWTREQVQVDDAEV